MNKEEKLAKEVNKKLRQKLKGQGENFIFPEELKRKIQSLTMIDLSELSFPLGQKALRELISNWQHCVELNLRDTSVTKEIADLLCELTNLRYLDLCRTNSDDSTLRAVAKCTQLEGLILDGCLQITSLDSLAACTKLQSLQFLLCYKITDLQPLRTCKELQSIVMSFCGEITDLRSLLSCKKMQSLCMRGCHGITVAEKMALQHALPHLTIEE